MTHLRFKWAALLVPVLAVIAAIFALGVGHSSQTAEAVNPVTIGLDMKANQNDPGTYTTFPTFENCVDISTSVNSGHFYFDVFIENVSGLFAFQADQGWLQFTAGKMQIEKATVKEFFGTGGSVSNYSRNVSDTTGDIVNPVVSDGSYHPVALDTGGNHTGSGVLVRFYAQAYIPGSGGTVINLSITQTAQTGLVLTADPGATHPGDTNGDGKFDGTIINKNSKIAVNRPDGDGDTISNDCDNCPTTANGPAQANVPNVGNQTDLDGDGVGDACDPDRDGDGIANASDNCPNNYNPTQDPTVCLDSDGDGVVNASDNCLDAADNCKGLANTNQADGDADGTGDVCDNCPTNANADQADMDHDLIGDVCDSDKDGDGIPNTTDNCPSNANANQADFDGDHIGDVCDPDTDNDTSLNTLETYVGTDNFRKCAATTTKNDEAIDAQPLDNNDDRFISGLDVLKYGPYFNQLIGSDPNKKRLDVNMNGRVDGLDILKFAPVFNTSCTP